MNSDSLAFHTLLINAMPGNHLVLLPNAPTFTMAAVSDDYLAVLNLQRDKIVGKGLFEVFLNQEQSVGAAEKLRQSLAQVVQSKQAHSMADLWHEWPNARTGVLEQRIWRPVNKPVPGPDGELAYIIHTVEDVTHSVNLVEITEANRYLQAIINGFKEPLQVLEPIWVDDQIVDFRFKLTNEAYAAYANATPEELAGKRVGEVFPGYFETESFSNPVETYRTGQPLTFEIHYDKDGLDLYNLMSTSRLDNQVVIHFTDFTRLRHLQRQLENKIMELERSNENLRQFAYVASHDLQEPLRKIRQFGDLLRERYGDHLEGGIDYLERMQQAAGHMSMLIRDLLAYCRLSIDDTNAQSVALTEVVEQALDNLSLLIEESSAQIDIDDLPTLPGDAFQLIQLFQNLLANALKFRRQSASGEAVKPHIQIRAKRIKSLDLPAAVQPGKQTDTYHLIEVSDNGIGFEDKHAQRIFQVFQRLHGKQTYKGTGVGLAIVEKVVANHGGSVMATGQPDQGATFSVYLPAADLV